jgi:hypothetical protein
MSKGVINPQSPFLGIQSSSTSQTPAPVLARPYSSFLLTGFPGWPHFFGFSADPNLSVCYDNTLYEYAYPFSYKSGGIKHHGTVHAYLNSVLFPDVAPPSKGLASAQCFGDLIIDYSGAPAMAAIQTGILVQAYWMALQDVIDEITHIGTASSGATVAPGLSIKSSVCQTLANQYLANLTTVGNLLLDIDKSFTPPAASLMNQLSPFITKSACHNSYASARAACNSPTTTQGTDEACKLVALIEGVSMQLFPDVAECEVVTRAHAYYNAVWGPATTASYPFVMNVIRDWAVNACNLSIIDGVANNFDQATAQVTAAAGSSYSESSTALVCTEPANAANLTCIYLPSSYPASTSSVVGVAPCLCEGSTTDLSSNLKSHMGEIPAATAGLLNPCFPIAYTALLKAYLDANGFRPVAIQGIAGQSSPYVSPFGWGPSSYPYSSQPPISQSSAPVSITNCQVSFTLPPKQ